MTFDGIGRCHALVTVIVNPQSPQEKGAPQNPLSPPSAGMPPLALTNGECRGANTRPGVLATRIIPMLKLARPSVLGFSRTDTLGSARMKES